MNYLTKTYKKVMIVEVGGEDYKVKTLKPLEATFKAVKMYPIKWELVFLLEPQGAKSWSSYGLSLG